MVILSAGIEALVAMEKYCCECAEPIKNLNLIKCHLCDHVAHIKCFGWARSNLDFVNSQSNLLWFCADCMKSVEQLKSPIATDLNNAVISSVSDVINGCMNGIKEELGQTNTLIKAVADKLLTISTPAMSSNYRSNKRPRLNSPIETPKHAKSTSKLFGGTRSVGNITEAVETVPKPAEKFWIYLSRIAPHVSEEQVAALVDKCIPGAQAIVRKLIKKGADLKSFAFVSFKVGVELNVKEQSLDPSTWPTGIYFRAFEERRSGFQDFWVPTRNDLSTPA